MASYASQTAGIGFSAYGALAQGKQTADLLDQQADIQRENAKQARMAAASNAERQSVIATKHIGGMTAGYAASGVDMSSGSVLATLGASAANAELDKQNIIHGGDIRAINFENQASMDESQASHAIKASYFNAFSSIAGGGAGMMNQNMGGGGGQKQDSYTTDYSQADKVTSPGGNQEQMMDAKGTDDLMDVYV